MIPPPPRSTLFPYTTLFRSDRAGRGRVTTVKLLLQLLHHLVAVAGLVLEQLEDDVLHVPRSEPLPAAAPGTPPEKATGTEAQRERIPSEMPSHGLPPVLHRYTMLREDIMARYILSTESNSPHIGLRGNSSSYPDA